MDETDLRLMLLLVEDSRTPYSALARRLKMSIPAVHKRVSTMMATGVITRFTATLSVGFLKAVPVYFSGASERFPIADAVERLGGSDRTSIVVTGSERVLHVRAILPTIQELEPYVAFFREAAAVTNPVISIESAMAYGSSPFVRAAPTAPELDALDWRILHALHDDARRPIADVCESLRVSPKTVRNRLRRLTEGGVTEFSLEIQPGAQAGVNAYLTIFLQAGLDVAAFRGRLVSDLGPRLLWSSTVSTHPDVLTVQVWSPTPAAHEELERRVTASAGVERVAAHYISRYDFFETWRDALLREKATARP